MKEKDALMLKLIEINHESKQKKNTEDYDELEAFMEQNNKELKKDEKEYISQRLKDANEEIGNNYYGRDYRHIMLLILRN